VVLCLLNRCHGYVVHNCCVGCRICLVHGQHGGCPAGLLVDTALMRAVGACRNRTAGQEAPSTVLAYNRYTGAACIDTAAVAQGYGAALLVVVIGCSGNPDLSSMMLSPLPRCFVCSVWTQVEAARLGHVSASRSAAVCLARCALHRHAQQVCSCDS
jgi:hypothetical protein